MRAPSAESVIRPGGVISSSQPTATHHQDTVGSQPSPKARLAMLLPAPIHVSHLRPTSVRSGIAQTSCPSWVLGGVGRTRRVLRVAGAVISSSMAAKPPIIGCS